MRLARGDSGFTLVELMVVVLIIGILIAIAIPVFNAAKGVAQQRQCFANQRTVEGAVESYLASTTSAIVPANETALWTALVPTFVKAIPECNSGGTYGWNATTKELSCSGANGVAGEHGHYN